MEHVCVIAEAGVNHNGSIELAKQMVDVAKDAGADYIKFQTFVPEKLVSKYAPKAEYQKLTTETDESQLQMLQKLALSKEEFIELKEYCDGIGIGFLSTPFDIDSIHFLENFNMDYWKLPSGEITNLPYLEEIARTGRRVIMSTGMSTIQEIQDAVSVLESYQVPEIILLHCNSQYPTPYEDVNLYAMREIEQATGRKTGYSDHTIGIEVPVAAVAMGACIIEKHFTLNQSMEGPDHKASLEPKELKRMIQSIRNIEQAKGAGKKKPSSSETPNLQIARKSIVACRPIKKGEIFSTQNLTTKRPGNGISPMKWNEIIGRKAIRDFSEDELIEV